MRICVFGAASNEVDQSYIDAVENLGEKMAGRGHSLVFGAGGGGLMGAAARGVHRGGQEVVGVIPHFFREERVEEIYPKCDTLIYTDTMAERKQKMEDLADAFIIVPGGVGTFEEFFEVFTLKQLAQHTKPIAIYDVNGYYGKLDDFLQMAVKERFIRSECREIYDHSQDADEILDYIEKDERAALDVHDLKNG